MGEGSKGLLSAESPDINKSKQVNHQQRRERASVLAGVLGKAYHINTLNPYSMAVTYEPETPKLYRLFFFACGTERIARSSG